MTIEQRGVHRGPVSFGVLVTCAALASCGDRVDIAVEDTDAARSSLSQPEPPQGSATASASEEPMFQLTPPPIEYDAQAACERACSYGRECGTGGLPIAITGIRCDAVEGCADEEACVQACLADIAWYDAFVPGDCVRTIDRIFACIETAACKPLVTTGDETWLDAEDCGLQLPQDFYGACLFATNSLCTSGPATVSALGTGETIDCTPSIACNRGTTLYQLDCNQAAGACTCRIDGEAQSTFEQEAPCDQLPGYEVNELEPYLGERCGFPLTP